MTSNKSHGFVPELTSKELYPLWKRKVEAWQILTEQAKPKQAIQLALKIKCETIAQAVFSKLTTAQMNTVDGVKILITQLDKICLANSVEGVFTAIEKLEQFHRTPQMTILSYLEEFERLKGLIDEHMPMKEDGTGKRDCVDSILAFRLMKQANLVESEELMVRAHVKALTTEEMHDVLKRIYGERIVGTSSSASGSGNSHVAFKPEVHVKQEVFNASCESHHDYEDENFYGNSNYYRRQNRPDKRKSESESQENVPNNKQWQKNPPGKHGQPSTCNKCSSIWHWARDCPQSSNNRNFKKKKFTYFTSDVFETVSLPAEQEDILTFAVSETVNKALLDTGAPSTVCGLIWFSVFIESLTKKEKGEIKELKSDKNFRFGDGKVVKAINQKIIPVTICGKEILLKTHVVNCDIPLLLSRESMKNLKCMIDLDEDKLWIDGQCQDLIVTESGHLLVTIGRCEETLSSNIVQDLTLISKSEHEDPRKCASHWHRYFAHASSKKIGEVIKNSKIPDKDKIISELKNLDKSCEFCLKHKRESPHKRVGLPLGKFFNNVVAMDLKQLEDKSLILHVIDTLTRYSSAVTVNSKKAEEIISKLFTYWISVFGRPSQFISDNGGEFINDEFTSMCEHLDIKVNTSPSESPWCNGLVERHNGILGQMVSKIQGEANCHRSIAIAWATNAKNTLNNVYGFSPHFLVFGCNPVIPNMLNTESLPALNSSTSSKIVADHLNAMVEARKAFVELENSDRLKRALRERVFPSSTARFLSGDKVYFKRSKTKEWCGPAEVVGQKDNQILIWNAGRIVKIHPCKVVLVKDAKKQMIGETDSIPANVSNEAENRAVLRGKADNRAALCDKAGDSAVLWEKAQSRASHQEMQQRTGDADDSSSLEDDDNSVDFAQPEIADVPVVANEGQQRSVLENPDIGNSKDDDPPHFAQSEIADVPAVANDNDHTENHSQIEKFKTTNQRSWCDVNNRDGKTRSSKAVQLKAGDVVRFKADDSNDWNRGMIMQRTGKIGGANQNTFNVDRDQEGQLNINCDKLQVEKLQQTTEEAVNSQLEEADDTVLLTKLADSPELKAAKQFELNRFNKFDVFSEEKDTGQPTVSSRWVVGEKDGAVKARLVARGYEELESDVSDAPTSTKSSKSIFFVLAASFKWKIESIDVTAAFLQADPTNRDIWIKPPKDIAKPGIIWKLKKPMYGLEDSSRKWYNTLKSTLCQLGCKMSKLDKAVFCYYDDDAKLLGIIVTHVDDLIYAGTTKFIKNVIQKLTKKFVISRLHSGTFQYLGWNITQYEDHIKVHQNTYAETIKSVKVDSQRKLQPDEYLDKDEVKQFQKLLGQLLWLSGQTRPDLTYETLEHSTYTKNATVKNQLSLNKVIKKLSDGPDFLRFNQTDIRKGEIKLVFYSDASLGNLPNRVDSARGYIIFLVDSSGIGSVICWSCNKIRRKVHSTFGAEALGFLDAISAALYTRNLISEILYQDSRSKVIPLLGVTDSKQVLESCGSTKQCSDRRLRLDIAEIQESVELENIEIKWTSTKLQLADVLTKKTANSRPLCEVLESGSLKGYVF